MHLGLTRPTVKAGAAIGHRQPGVIDSWVPPGGGFTFPHWHQDFEEVFYVLDGQIDYLTGSTWATASPRQHHLRARHGHPRLPQHQRRPGRHLAIGPPAEMVDLAGDPEHGHARPVRGGA